jgi:hypothetical protein
MTPPKKTITALATVVTALQPLDPESRRRVIEAVHSLLPIARGEQGKDRPAKGARRK